MFSANFGDDGEARDLLGRTYEYFIKEFARAEGHRGGEFYTPKSVTKLLKPAVGVRRKRHLTLIVGGAETDG